MQVPIDFSPITDVVVAGSSIIAVIIIVIGIVKGIVIIQKNKNNKR